MPVTPPLAAERHPRRGKREAPGLALRRPLYIAAIDPRVAGDTESDAGRVRLLGYRAGAPNAGHPVSKNVHCQTLFLRCKKSSRVGSGSRGERNERQHYLQLRIAFASRKKALVSANRWQGAESLQMSCIC
jgi:hypothetical protein